MGRIFVGLGRHANIRPGDLMGAVVNESGLDGRLIGAIEVHDRFSIIEVPEDAVDHVIECLRRTTLRNRKAPIKRDRGSR